MVDAPLSPLAMVLVVFPIVGVLWLATGKIRKTRRRLYARVLKTFVLICAASALAGIGLKAPKVLVDWLVTFGFAFVTFDILMFYRSRAEDERKQEAARLAEIDRSLKQMRDGTR
jgi:hypothetical protein